MVQYVNKPTVFNYMHPFVFTKLFSILQVPGNKKGNSDEIKYLCKLWNKIYFDNNYYRYSMKIDRLLK